MQRSRALVRQAIWGFEKVALTWLMLKQFTILWAAAREGKLFNYKRRWLIVEYQNVSDLYIDQAVLQAVNGVPRIDLTFSKPHIGAIFNTAINATIFMATPLIMKRIPAFWIAKIRLQLTNQTFRF